MSERSFTESVVEDALPGGESPKTKNKGDRPLFRHEQKLAAISYGSKTKAWKSQTTFPTPMFSSRRWSRPQSRPR